MGITTIYIEDAKENEYVSYEKIATIVTNIIENINLSENASLISNLAHDDEISKLALHSLDVTILTLMVGIRKNFDNAKLIKLGNAALLHDIGKLFTDSYDHPEIGYKLVKKSSEFAVTTYMAIYYLYEREDGSGPLGIHGEKLNEFIKIISICNEYIKSINIDNGMLPHEAIEKITAYCYPNGFM